MGRGRLHCRPIMGFSVHRVHTVSLSPPLLSPPCTSELGAGLRFPLKWIPREDSSANSLWEETKGEEGRGRSQDGRVDDCDHQGVRELGGTLTPQLPRSCPGSLMYPCFWLAHCRPRETQAQRSQARGQEVLGGIGKCRGDVGRTSAAPATAG